MFQDIVAEEFVKRVLRIRRLSLDRFLSSKATNFQAGEKIRSP